MVDAQETTLTEPEISTESHLEAPHPPTGILPSFPLPSLPNAPSKSVLALQGLDQALVDAELVDPTTLLTIPDGSKDGGTHLSERMRRRLQDLGITELFAVQTSLLPFLLPRDPFQKALYQPYNPPRDVCIGTATGQQSFSHEQSQLIADRSSNLKGGSSKVDILICTPGRLMDHLHETPNFSLQHLRFLVIDEADRLLAQSFQDWLAQVLAATRPSTRTEDSPSTGSSISPADAVAPAFLHNLPYPDIPIFPTEPKASSCQKLLFSATLTRDPGKIAALDLRDPKYFIVQESKKEGVLDVVMEKFSVPATLTVNLAFFPTHDGADVGEKEHMVIIEGDVLQARYFKGILREADHLDRVKRLRVGEKDLAPLIPAYEVCPKATITSGTSDLLYR
ncbi:hypothetical protein C0992_001568 [Termitomyces sp. T32_za158]|nr:hypothetical protein C0992_001568 [Termitomyces sp. T32_za158]